MRELTSDDIKRLITVQFKKIEENLEDFMVEEWRPESNEEHEEQLELMDSFLSDSKKDLAFSQFGEVIPHVEKLLQGNGFNIDRASFVFKKLCREYLKLRVREFELHKKALVGDPLTEEQRLIEAVPTTVHPKPQPEPSEPLSTVIEAYLSEQEKGSRWTAKSKEDLAQSLSQLVWIIGDVPVKSIDHRAMR